METSLVSIIIPVYNVEKYLDRCMQSVFLQSYKNLEIILIDDGSPDSCPRLCDEYGNIDKRVRVLHKKNEGLGFARNSGLALATGQYVLFIDSDDYLSETMVEKLVCQAELMNADIVYCGYFYETSNHKWIEVRDFEKEQTFKGNDIEAVSLAFITNQNKLKVRLQRTVWHALYSKELIDDEDIRFPSERQIPSEDLIFQSRISKFANIISFVPDCLYYYCLNNNSITMNFKKDRYLKLVNEKNELLRIYSNKEVDRYINNLYFISIKSYFYNLIEQKNITFSEKNKIIKEVVIDMHRDCINHLEPGLFSKAEKIFYVFVCIKNIFLIFVYCFFINLLFKIINKTRF